MDPSAAGAAQGSREHRQQSKALELGSSSSSELLGSTAASPSLWINPLLSPPPSHNLPFALFPPVRKIPYTSAVGALPGQFEPEASAGTFALFSSLAGTSQRARGAEGALDHGTTRAPSAAESQHLTLVRLHPHSPVLLLLQPGGLHPVHHPHTRELLPARLCCCFQTHGPGPPRRGVSGSQISGALGELCVVEISTEAK